MHHNKPPAVPATGVSVKFTGRTVSIFLDTQISIESPSDTLRVEPPSILIITAVYYRHIIIHIIFPIFF